MAQQQQPQPNQKQTLSPDVILRIFLENQANMSKMFTTAYDSWVEAKVTEQQLVNEIQRLRTELIDTKKLLEKSEPKKVNPEPTTTDKKKS